MYSQHMNNTEKSLVIIQQSVSQNIRKIKSLLPHHISPEKFCRTVITAIENNPDLLQCSQESIIKAALYCATDGLIPDGREAAFVKFKNTAQYIPMYQGLIKRAINSGIVRSIEAHIVYKNDALIYKLGTHRILDHTPEIMGDRGEMIGVYAIAFFKGSDDYQYKYLRKDEIDENKNNNPVWNNHYNAMAMKTAVRQLMKWLPFNADIAGDSPLNEKAVEKIDSIVIDGEAQSPPPVQSLTQGSQQPVPNDKLGQLEIAMATNAFQENRA